MVTQEATKGGPLLKSYPSFTLTLHQFITVCYGILHSICLCPVIPNLVFGAKRPSVLTHRN